MMEQVIIIVDDKQYVVASTVIVKEELFGYLVNVADNNDVIFARLDDDENISKIEDANLIQALIPLFLENQDYFKTE